MKRQSWIILTMACLLFGCAHVSTPPQPKADFLSIPRLQQLTFDGNSEHPRYSPDGTKIIFASGHRNNSKGMQIYELDLTKNRERRVTFSDGDAFDPVYISESEIIYASTTDAIKEDFFIKVNPKLPPADLYMSDRYGMEILRLTREPNYDGEPLYYNHPTKPFILFTSGRDNNLGIYRVDLSNMTPHPITVRDDKHSRFPALTPDGKSLAYVEMDNKSQEQSIVFLNTKTGKTEKIKSGEGAYRDLFFAPHSPLRLFYSVLRKGQPNYQIESYDLEDKCTQVLFKSAESLTGPTVSSDSHEKLAFVGQFQNKRDIYQTYVPESPGPCLESVTAKTP